jgi:restriction system protein
MLNLSCIVYNDYKVYKSYNDYMEFGGYKSLPFYLQAEIIYDFTVEFVKLYIDYKSRTKDQMEQAARSGKQNIAEGYLQKSVESKLRLLNVSRGSLEELLNDYQDFLRQHQLPLWDLNSTKAKAVRSLVYYHYNCYNNYKDYINNQEAAANSMVCLINQTNQLLDQKLRWLEADFVKHGGFRENLFKKRMDYKKNQ